MFLESLAEAGKPKTIVRKKSLFNIQNVYVARLPVPIICKAKLYEYSQFQFWSVAPKIAWSTY